MLVRSTLQGNQLEKQMKAGVKRHAFDRGSEVSFETRINERDAVGTGRLGCLRNDTD
jgi:hypothetical protein